MKMIGKKFLVILLFFISCFTLVGCFFKEKEDKFITKISIVGKNEMIEGETQKLKVSILPNDKELEKSILMESSDTKIIKVSKEDEYAVEAISAGEATVIFFYLGKDSELLKEEFKITVKEKEDGPKLIITPIRSATEIGKVYTIEGKVFRVFKNGFILKDEADSGITTKEEETDGIFIEGSDLLKNIDLNKILYITGELSDRYSLKNASVVETERTTGIKPTKNYTHIELETLKSSKKMLEGAFTFTSDDLEKDLDGNYIIKGTNIRIIAENNEELYKGFTGYGFLILEDDCKKLYVIECKITAEKEIVKIKSLVGERNEKLKKTRKNSNTKTEPVGQYVVIYKNETDIKFTITLDNPKGEAIDAIELTCDDPNSKILVDGEYIPIQYNEKNNSIIVNWAQENPYKKTYFLKTISDDNINTVRVIDIKVNGEWQNKELEKDTLKIYKMNPDNLVWEFVVNTASRYTWKLNVKDPNVIKNIVVKADGVAEDVKYDEKAGTYTVEKDCNVSIEYEYVFDGLTLKDKKDRHIVLLKIVRENNPFADSYFLHQTFSDKKYFSHLYIKKLEGTDVPDDLVITFYPKRYTDPTLSLEFHYLNRGYEYYLNDGYYKNGVVFPSYLEVEILGVFYRFYEDRFEEEK